MTKENRFDILAWKRLDKDKEKCLNCGMEGVNMNLYRKDNRRMIIRGLQNDH